MIDDLKKKLKDVIFGIEQFRLTHPKDSLFSYDDGRYEAYNVVLNWINTLERREHVAE